MHKDSQTQKAPIFFIVPLHTDNENHVHRPQILKLALLPTRKGLWIEIKDTLKIIKQLQRKYYKDKIFNPKLTQVLHQLQL